MAEVAPWRIVRHRLTNATGAVGYAAGRVYPSVLPADPRLPAYTYETISTQREHAMQQEPGHVHARVQVDIYDDAFYGSASGALRAVEALDRYQGMATGIEVHGIFLANERDTVEEDLDDSERTVWRRTLDFMVHYQE